MRITELILAFVILVGIIACDQEKKEERISFNGFIEKLNESPPAVRSQLVDQYLSQENHKQIIDDQNKKHLIWYGKADSVKFELKEQDELKKEEMIRIDCGELNFFYKKDIDSTKIQPRFFLDGESLNLLTKTKDGPVIGIVENGIISYRGIRYAAPPVGEFRWRPPQPVEPWSTPFQADTYGCACAQEQSKKLPDWSKAYFETVGISEDCLTLNLWRPAKKQEKPLPVMVYIHGSGWKYASSSWPVWTGEELARKGVLVVNFNYRLGLTLRTVCTSFSK